MRKIRIKMSDDKKVIKEKEGDKIWEQIKDLQMSWGGLPQKSLSSFYTKYIVQKSHLIVKRTSPASALDHILDKTLNTWMDRSGSLKTEEKFLIEPMENSLVKISRLTDSKNLAEDDE